MALKVYLVFGGFTSTTGSPPIASTELLLHGDSSWTQVGPLPHSLYGLKAVSLNNDVIATGDDIYFLIGKMQNPMHYCRRHPWERYFRPLDLREDCSKIWSHHFPLVRGWDNEGEEKQSCNECRQRRWRCWILCIVEINVCLTKSTILTPIMNIITRHDNVKCAPQPHCLKQHKHTTAFTPP